MSKPFLGKFSVRTSSHLGDNAKGMISEMGKPWGRRRARNPRHCRMKTKQGKKLGWKKKKTTKCKCSKLQQSKNNLNNNIREAEKRGGGRKQRGNPTSKSPFLLIKLKYVVFLILLQIFQVKDKIVQLDTNNQPNYVLLTRDVI